jgi:hypothetical protein
MARSTIDPAPSGRKVSYLVASFVQIEGDSIRSEQVYVDWYDGSGAVWAKLKAK